MGPVRFAVAPPATGTLRVAEHEYARARWTHYRVVLYVVVPWLQRNGVTTHAQHRLDNLAVLEGLIDG